MAPLCQARLLSKVELRIVSVSTRAEVSTAMAPPVSCATLPAN
jgi:hypothetical protein